ncbi:MAG: tetratricopeptide repeat protein [Planctomycetes bacterium]|nr:tetratricopeptide repeat protein [Planctomycetota bacterium]
MQAGIDSPDRRPDGADRPTDRRGPFPGRWYRRPLPAMAVIVALALAIRLGSYLDLRRSPLFDGATPFIDARYYDFRAKSIAGGDLWGDDVFFMSPLYEYTLALPYALTGQGIAGPDPVLARREYRPTLAIVIQCFYGSISCGLLLLLGRRLFGWTAGWLAGLAAACYAPFVFFDGVLMTASLILFVNLVALLLLVQALRRGGWGWWLGTGAALGLAAIAHGGALLLVPACIAVLAWSLRRCPLPATLARGAALVGGFGAVVLPVTARNYVVGNDLVLISSNAGMNFFIGNNPAADGCHRVYQYPYRLATLGARLGGVQRTRDDPPPSAVSREIGMVTIRWISGHPLEAVKLWGRKLRLLIGAVEPAPVDWFYFCRPYSAVLRSPLLVYGLIAPVGLTGLCVLLPRMGDLRAFYLVFVVQVISFTAAFVLGRLRFVMTACLILFAAGQVIWWVDRFRRREYRRLAGSVVLLALWVILVHFPIEGFDRQRKAGMVDLKLAAAYKARGEIDRAIEHYRRAGLRPAEDFLTPARRWMALSARGDLQARHGRVADARASFEAARRIIDETPRPQMQYYVPRERVTDPDLLESGSHYVRRRLDELGRIEKRTPREGG